ncbi:MAG: DRTGG domain-containing protein [Chitinispirillaceae bacterium]
MNFEDIVQTLDARIIHRSSQYDSVTVKSVVISDLMSDVLVMEKPSPLIVSSLSSEQTLRTASMVDAPGVLIAQNKPLPEGITELAQELDITLLHTSLPKFETCVLLGRLLEKKE